MPENRYGRCGHEADRAPQHVGVEVAHVDAADEHAALGAVEQPQDEVDERRLARAGAADDRGGLPGRGRERDVAEHRVLGAGVVEADVAELERAVRRRRRAPGSAGGTTLGSVSSTSWMRSADTDARGIIDTMNVAITTDIRICTR